ncbi:Uncharacterised protein [Vibrio cholerae]|nr:Uncharacterised protein [Vibrio cholerae]CSI86045.1 Uncharacterised protein [Vibrio cholerae]
MDKHNSWTIVCFWFALVVTKPLPSSLLSGTARSTTGIRDNFIVSIFPISRRQATIICAWNTRILPLLLLREAY